MCAEWTQQHLKKFNVTFEETDKDHSGSLSLDEVANVLQKNGFKGKKEDAKALFKQLDLNKDDKVTRDEFSAAISKLPRITVREYVLRKAFNSLDKDSSGKLSRAEIESAMKTSGCDDVKMSRARLDQLLAELERDTKDNVVDYEEFLRVMGMEEEVTVMSYVFNKLDKDNSGFLTKDELMAAIHNESELKLRAAKISDLLVACHKDADQKLDYKEFLAEWVKFK
ncbi:16 kDa calcium-binding protein-like [Babylonia areolata]|uniref:16 kDa calcium-binding protein-like n=1 Tax=Babylonia areolata TaxID=304850 RepID=UPI003FD4C066